MAEDKDGFFPPSNTRVHLRGVILVTHVRVSGERKYFFGYAKNVSRSGMFIQSVTPRNVGEEFNIEFTLPKTDILIKCRAVVIWKRIYSHSKDYEPGMGISFLNLDPDAGDEIEKWVVAQVQADPSKKI